MKFLVAVLLVPFLCALVPGQSKDGTLDVYAPVPEQVRARLVEQANLYIEYERTKQWDKLYGLLYRKDEEQKRFLKEFRAMAGSVRPTKFVPWSVSFTGKDKKKEIEYWLIKGCAKYSNGETLESDLIAYLTKGDWYFSILGATVQGFGEPVTPCSKSKNRPKK